MDWSYSWHETTGRVMKGATILAVTRDSDWLVGMRPAMCEAGRWRLVVADSIQEGETLLECASPEVVVVDWRRESSGVEALATLLWKNSIQKRRASVMIVAADYDVAEATHLYRLGIDEYVSQADHRDVLGAVLSAHIPARLAAAAWNHAPAAWPDATPRGLFPIDRA